MQVAGQCVLYNWSTTQLGPRALLVGIEEHDSLLGRSSVARLCPLTVLRM